MRLRVRAGRWAALELQAHDPEVQAKIAEAIVEGAIRVVPARPKGIRIIPLRDGQRDGMARAANAITGEW